MDSKEIDELFQKIAPDSAGDDDQGARQVFKSLVETTLTYRDQLKDKQAFILTVEDVRIVLDWLMAYMQTGKAPETHDKIRAELFKLWTTALTPKTA